MWKDPCGKRDGKEHPHRKEHQPTNAAISQRRKKCQAGDGEGESNIETKNQSCFADQVGEVSTKCTSFVIPARIESPESIDDHVAMDWRGSNRHGDDRRSVKILPVMQKIRHPQRTTRDA